jgi:hypothetical protein
MSSNKNFEKLDEYYASRKLTCPNCATNKDVIPCVFGRPTTELQEYAQAGHVKLIGCSPVFDKPFDDDPNKKQLEAFCNKCNLEIFI